MDKRLFGWLDDSFPVYVSDKNEEKGEEEGKMQGEGVICLR